MVFMHEVCLLLFHIRPLQYNSLFLITTVDAPGCGRAVNIITSLVPHLHLYMSKQLLQHLGLGLGLVPGCVTTMICTQEHHRLAQHAERQTRVNRTGPEYSRKCCVQQTAHAQFFPRLQVVWERVPQT